MDGVRRCIIVDVERGNGKMETYPTQDEKLANGYRKDRDNVASTARS